MCYYCRRKRIAPETLERMEAALEAEGNVQDARSTFQICSQVNDQNMLNYATDRSVNPTSKDWHRLQAKLRTNLFGDRNGEEALKKLKHLATSDPQHYGFSQSASDSGCWSFVIQTDLMRRVGSNIDATKHMLFVDSSASCDTTDTSITFIVSSTPVGALPVMVLLHSRQDTVNYM